MVLLFGSDVGGTVIVKSSSGSGGSDGHSDGGSGA